MFALVKNDGSIKLFAPYTVFEDKNGTQYSPETLISWTADEKHDAGIYDVAYATRPDDQYYTITENEPTFDSDEKVVKVTYNVVAKDLEDAAQEGVKGVKSQSIDKVNNIANSLLKASDWMLVRKIERGVDVPTATSTYRAAVIAESNRLVAAISAAFTLEQIVELLETANWPAAE